MKKLIETIRNIFKIEELRKRILYTLGIILIYRLGSYIVLPGVDPHMLSNLQQQGSSGLMGLLNEALIKALPTGSILTTLFFVLLVFFAIVNFLLTI